MTSSEIVVDYVQYFGYTAIRLSHNNRLCKGLTVPIELTKDEIFEVAEPIVDELERAMAQLTPFRDAYKCQRCEEYIFANEILTHFDQVHPFVTKSANKN